jgi:hypothetical protein
VSDNNNAKIYIKGPNVQANLPHKFSKSEIQFKLAEIDGNLMRCEYDKALNSIVVFVLTQRKYASPEDEKTYEDKILSMLDNEIRSIKSSKSSSAYVQQQNIEEFVKMTKNLFGILPFDEDFIEKVLSLTEVAPMRRTKRLTFTTSYHKPSSVTTTSADHIQNVLSLYDKLSEDSLRRDKKSFVKRIHQFVATMCRMKNLNAQAIRMIIIELIKIIS